MQSRKNVLVGLLFGFCLFFTSSSMSNDVHSPAQSVGRAKKAVSYINSVQKFLKKQWEWLLFFKEFACNWRVTGSTKPSSPALAKAITQPLLKKKPLDRRIRVLEVGAGTGPFTKVIINILKKLYGNENFIFDVIEINKSFYKILKDKFGNERGVSIHGKSILDWDPSYHYDFIISGLPFNSLPFPVVYGALDQYENLIKEGGIVSFFEYLDSVKNRKLLINKKKSFLGWLSSAWKSEWEDELRGFEKMRKRVHGFIHSREHKFIKVEEDNAWAIHVHL